MDLFTNTYSWGGGDVELAIEVPDRSSQAVCALLEVLWSAPGIAGPYLDSEREPETQTVVPVCGETPFRTPLVGVTTINGVRLPCSTVVITAGEVWMIFFGIPIAAVETFAGLDWGGIEKVVIPWLIDFAQCIFAKRTFELALIGAEINDAPTAASIRDGVPAKRGRTYLVRQGERLVTFEQTEGLFPR